jgi:hypothetical protein
MADELHSCPRCGGEIEGIAIWQNEQIKRSTLRWITAIWPATSTLNSRRLS